MGCEFFYCTSCLSLLFFIIITRWSSVYLRVTVIPFMNSLFTLSDEVLDRLRQLLLGIKALKQLFFLKTLVNPTTYPDTNHHCFI